MDFEQIAERICRQVNVYAAGNSGSLSSLLRDALLQARDTGASSALTECQAIAEEEAGRSRAVGNVGGHQTALIIAARIRKHEVEVE